MYSITIDGEQGTVKVTGRVNPSSLLGVLDKYGRHGELKYIKFDGEIIQQTRSPSCYCYFAEHDNQYYSPYGLINTNNNYYTYPPPLGLFPQPHHYLYHEPNYLGFVPPPVPPPLRPAMPLWATPPFPPPLAPF